MLCVWLPLNGDLHNQGLSNLTFINNTSNIVIDDNGKIGKCYTRGTVKTNGRIISNENILLDGDLSMCCWAKVTATVGDTANGLVSNHNASTNKGFGITVKQVSTSDYRICCSTGNGSSRTYYTYYGTTNIKDAWHHLALTYSHTKKQFQLWVDGKVEKTQSYTNSAEESKISIFNWNLGSDAANYHPACSLNDVRIYNHCLSAKEVEEIAKGLVLHYKLDNNGMCNPNILTGTYYNSYKPGLSTSTTARNIDGKWTGGSGGNGSFSVTEDITCPIGKYSWNILNNTSGNRDFQQGDQPYVGGQVYTTSFWAKGSGTCLYRSWNSTDGKQMFSKTWTLTNNWTYYTYTFTASTEMETDKCTFHLGVTGASSISICGMKMEKGNSATSYSLAIGEMIDNNIIYDSSGYNNNGIIVGNTSSEMFSPKYNTGIYMNNINTANRIEHTIDFLTEQLTISFWVKLIAKRGQVLFAMPTIQCCMNNAGTYFYINSTSDKGYSASTILDDNWNFLTITKNNNLYSFYINGISIPATGSATFWTHNGDKLYILNRNANNNYAAEAFLSDFRIYTTILTEEQIKELYNTSATIDNLGNIHAREFDENSNLNITKTGLFQASEIKDGDYQIASILKNTNSIQGNNLYEY